jgi:hypothetical protein
VTSAEAALAARVLEAVRDPRPEYAGDSGPWARLLRLVYLVETLNEASGVAPGPSARDSLFGVLHGFRSGGARLTYDPRAAGGRGCWRLAPRLSPKVDVGDEANGTVARAAGETLWATADEYREDARAFLLPHRSLLGRLLVELPTPGDRTRVDGPARAPARGAAPASPGDEGGAGQERAGGPQGEQDVRECPFHRSRAVGPASAVLARPGTRRRRGRGGHVRRPPRARRRGRSPW